MPPRNTPRSSQWESVLVFLQFHTFEPKTLTIHAGETLEWRNTSFIWHTVTADPHLAQRPQDVLLPPGALPFDSGKLDPKGTFRHTFTVPGTYRYFCQPHELNGMLGEVIVEPPRPQ